MPEDLESRIRQQLSISTVDDGSESLGLAAEASLLLNVSNYREYAHQSREVIVVIHG